MNDVTRTEQTTLRVRQRGSYTANLLGNIKSHLAGLQGYDVMALELIQNADDARAAEIVFDITDRGLLVINSGQFTYCGDLETRPCGFTASDNYACDYHRIADVGSGGKLSHGDNIGRFGIGFVSTYQITDHPEIRSAGIKLTLYPEAGQWAIEPFDEPNGTSFFLPWAHDPRTEARLALGVSHVTAEHISQLANDFQRVLRESLLFLRHVRKAEVRRNGQLLSACDLDRGDGSDLIVSFRPGGDVEHWQVLRADAAEAAASLYAAHPRLEPLARSTKISIALRIDPEPLLNGSLYAFLPTEQPTGLPLHINADFFPEADRKAIIFAGHQHEEAWNAMLIDSAALELARDPEGLMRMLGPGQLWEILSRAYELSRASNHPRCFRQFWERLKITAIQARIVPAQDGSVQCPSGVFLPRTPLDALEAKTLLEVGGRTASEELRRYYTAMTQLGAPILTLERLVALLERAMPPSDTEEPVPEPRLLEFYLPLWGIIDDLLPDGSPAATANSLFQRLQAIPFIITEDLLVMSMSQSYLTPAALDAKWVAGLLPRLAVASHHVAGFKRLVRLMRGLDLGAVVARLASLCASEPIQEIIGVERQALRDLYTLLSDLDRYSSVDSRIYRTLAELPIWLSSRGLVKATDALLPGDFNDPTGLSQLLETSVLTESAKQFLTGKLRIPTQTIATYVQTVLPRFFTDEGPIDEQKYATLVGELANHPKLIDDDNIRRLLGSLPIVPTQDGRWARPSNAYRCTDALVKVLGEAWHLWLDTSRTPSTWSVQSFLDSLGILRSPVSRHLADRMLSISEHTPTDDARRASAEAFYVLSDNFDVWKDKKPFQDALADLRAAECFPALGDRDKWHRPGSLYAPYRLEAFESQARILDFTNRARLNRDLLRAIGISVEPETRLVIEHLRECAKRNVPVHFFAYQILNERSKDEGASVSTLTGEPFVYIEKQNGFVRSNQLFWLPQQLGRYAFTIPADLQLFRPLFTAVGVKDAPDGKDFVDILLDIIGEYFEQSKQLAGPDRLVYEACLAGIASADERGELSAADLQRLREAPSTLNVLDHPTYPDELLLQDSEWHATFFRGELNRALCKPIPELWPLIHKIGVGRLSEEAVVALEFFDGEKVHETQFAERLKERAGIVGRLLHDKPTTVQRRIRESLGEIDAVSYEVVRIETSVRIGNSHVAAPPAGVPAFYDMDRHTLILARPVGDRSWPHILNAFFHQLMPEEAGSEIAKLTLSLRPLMAMSIEESSRELTDAGVPDLDAATEDRPTQDLTSSELGDMGVRVNPDEQDDGTSHAATTEVSRTQPNVPESAKQQENALEGRPASRGERSDSTLSSEARGSKSSQKHKSQWDRRLLSYVRKTAVDAATSEGDAAASEHNLGVEAVARAAVCTYERTRGRVPEPMAQTHPGYDIISRNPLTGEERFIEVKGVSGEWNQTGVGLSRLQFSNAQNYGDRYWLYVAEFVSDHEHTRIHPIRSPATQVTSFMFDGNWRDAAAEERADPTLAFIAGARINHQNFGYGRIVSMELRGSTRVLSVEFDKGGRRTVTLNLHLMSIVEDNDNDHS